MTAVELLMQTLEQNNIIDLDLVDSDKYYAIIEQAKEMEKQQIIDAVNVTSQNCVSISNKVISAFLKIDGEFMHDENEAEKYYNETYGSKGSDETKTDKI